MEKVMTTSKFRRYSAERLCEYVCLIDHYPEEEGYKQPAPHGVFVYYPKIIKEAATSHESVRAMRREARELNKQWKEGPDYQRQVAEVKEFYRILNIVTLKYRNISTPD